MSRIRTPPRRPPPARHAGRRLPIPLLAALALACATAGSGNRTPLPITEARSHAIAALQQYGYVIVNDGGRGIAAGDELPEQLTVTGERQQQTSWQRDGYATISLRITLRRRGSGPATSTELTVSPSVRHQSSARGGGSDRERQQMDALARSEAAAVRKAILSAVSVGWE